MYKIFVIFFAEYAIFLLAVPVLFFWIKGRRTLVIKSIFSAALAVSIAGAIKNFYPQTRPDSAGSILGFVEGGSFPSGHTALAFALATIILFYRRTWGILFYAVSILIGTSRVLGGAHRTLDIVAGALLGLVVGNIVKQLALYLKSK